MIFYIINKNEIKRRVFFVLILNNFKNYNDNIIK